MEVDLVRIAVAVEIAPELDRVFVGARNRRELGFKCRALGLAAAPERLGEREAIELGQVLQVVGSCAQGGRSEGRHPRGT